MAGKQKIFIEATSLIGHLSGVGHVTLETVRALDNDDYKDKYEIKVFAPSNERALMERYKFNNIQVAYLPFPHKFLSLFSRLPIAPPLDLFLGRGVYIFPNFRNWNLLASKSMTYIHDACFAIYPQYVEPRNLHFLKAYTGLWKRRTDRIVAVSHASHKEINAYIHIPETKLATISNAVDTTFYSRSSTDEISEMRKKYNLKENYFLFIGNIEPRKNLQTLITAFTNSNLKDKAGLFIVGGDGWLNDDIHKAINEAQALGFDIKKNMSYVPDEDVPALMSGASSVVQPSWHEGFGMPVVQSLACETPVICSDIPSLREVTAGFESMAQFFKPDDDKTLTSLLEGAIEHQNQSSIDRTKLRTWNQAAHELVSLVDTVSAGGKS